MNIYLASPVATFEQVDRYNRMKEDAKMILDGFVIPARGLYGSMEAWRRKWPDVRKEVDCLAFFTDTDGTIGRATYWEIMDIHKDKKPVWWFKEVEGDIVNPIAFRNLEFIVINGDINWTKYRRVQPRHATTVKNR